MRRGLFLLPLLIAVVAIACTSGATVDNDGDLHVSFTQVVLDNGPHAYHLQGDVTATYFCNNSQVGQIFQSAGSANNSSQNGTFTPVNKKVSGALTQPVPAPNALWVTNCQTALTVTAEWTNIVVKNLTNGFDINVPDASTAP